MTREGRRGRSSLPLDGGRFGEGVLKPTDKIVAELLVEDDRRLDVRGLDLTPTPSTPNTPS